VIARLPRIDTSTTTPDHKSSTRFTRIAVAPLPVCVAMISLLGACGGDDEPATPAPTTIPAEPTAEPATADPTADLATAEPTAAATDGQIITAEQAGEIAAAHVGGTVDTVSAETDCGAAWDVDVYAPDGEYTLYIGATGEIVRVDGPFND